MKEKIIDQLPALIKIGSTSINAKQYLRDYFMDHRHHEYITGLSGGKEKDALAVILATKKKY